MKTIHKRKVSVEDRPRCCRKVRHCEHTKVSQKRNTRGAGTRPLRSKPAIFLDTSVYTVGDPPRSFSPRIRILIAFLFLLATFFLLHGRKNLSSVNSQKAH